MYEMNDIDRTQIAITYIYVDKVNYQKIYCISIAIEAFILSGFQDITATANCTSIDTDFDPTKLSQFGTFVVCVEKKVDFGEVG